MPSPSPWLQPWLGGRLEAAEPEAGALTGTLAAFALALPAEGAAGGGGRCTAAQPNFAKSPWPGGLPCGARERLLFGSSAGSLLRAVGGKNAQNKTRLIPRARGRRSADFWRCSLRLRLDLKDGRPM